jgi:hypothetical protein
LLLGSPDTIHNVLDVQNEVGLAVSSIAEWHVGWVCLGNRS